MKNRRKFFNGYLFLSGFAFIYVALELLFYILACVGMGDAPVLYRELTVANKNFARFDSLSGYKWVHDDLRFIRIHDDYVVYDNKVTPNLQGYISEKDYQPAKDTGVNLRFLVFGDSFTGGEYLNKTWPDQVQNFLGKRYGASFSQRVELYSFALSGTGLPNWYQIFRKEAFPDYEFDGLIFAIYGDNLNRGFAIMESREDTAYFNWFGNKPPESNDDYEKNFKKQMWSIGYVLGDAAMDSILAEIQAKEKSRQSKGLKTPGFHFLHFIKNRLTNSVETMLNMGDERNFKRQFFEPDENLKNNKLEISYISNKYGDEKVAMLEEMVAFCKKNEKKIIFCSIPEQDGLMVNKRGKVNQVQMETRSLSEHFNALYFDGYEIFKDVSADSIRNYYNKYDEHWSQRGSDLFAEKFAEFLAENGLN